MDEIDYHGVYVPKVFMGSVLFYSPKAPFTFSLSHFECFVMSLKPETPDPKMSQM